MVGQMSRNLGLDPDQGSTSKPGPTSAAKTSPTINFMGDEILSPVERLGSAGYGHDFAEFERSHASSSRVLSDEARLRTLTDREQQVLRLVALNGSTQSIAKILKISNKTVEFHWGHIKEKLVLQSDLTTAIVEIYRRGFVPDTLLPGLLVERARDLYQRAGHEKKHLPPASKNGS